MISAHNYFPFLFDLYLFVYTSCLVRPYEARAWEERRGSGGVPSVLLPECFPNLSLLAPGQPDVHHHQYGEHHQREERRPLEQDLRPDGASILWQQSRAQQGGVQAIPIKISPQSARSVEE